MLTFTNTLNPKITKVESRLSDRALVPIFADVTSSARTPRKWVDRARVNAYDPKPEPADGENEDGEASSDEKDAYLLPKSPHF
ncbi:hypothetical protein GN244_ATG08012 [Phytophthora infestans]|uniref:Uncharacterized protein n=1 Tax=Phytophthora infestans TaxID=4787 RepID=A0A833WF26_PHYIN|nr:hypothetical protein GN244_ATG08012 [Phytophthora infestans]KAF4147860.1 hypothetical protein GN958_ATG02926 [Phytophthora infestans]